MTTTPTNPSATPSAVAAVNSLVGGDETRERGRHDGDETQQNGGDAARDVPLAGEEKRVMGSDNERTADEHVDIVVPSPGAEVRAGGESGGKQQRGGDVEAHGGERHRGKVCEADVRRHERRPQTAHSSKKWPAVR